MRTNTYRKLAPCKPVNPYLAPHSGSLEVGSTTVAWSMNPKLFLDSGIAFLDIRIIPEGGQPYSLNQAMDEEDMPEHLGDLDSYMRVLSASYLGMAGDLSDHGGIPDTNGSDLKAEWDRRARAYRYVWCDTDDNRTPKGLGFERDGRRWFTRDHDLAATIAKANDATPLAAMLCRHGTAGDLYAMLNPDEE